MQIIDFSIGVISSNYEKLKIHLLQVTANLKYSEDGASLLKLVSGLSTTVYGMLLVDSMLFL